MVNTITSIQLLQDECSQLSRSIAKLEFLNSEFNKSLLELKMFDITENILEVKEQKRRLAIKEFTIKMIKG